MGMSPTLLNLSLYPKLSERHNFYRAYLEATMKLNWINRDSDTPTPPAIDTPVNNSGTSSDSFGHVLETRQSEAWHVLCIHHFHRLDPRAVFLLVGSTW
jgi:hypothetical protein